MAKSSIEWTSHTWNPVTGCSKVSAGCKFCYAEVMSRRLQAMGVEKYKDNFEVRMHPDALLLPYTWKKSKIVFVNSMSDLFHKEVSTDFILQVFKVMNDNPQHTFQVLTKRAERLPEINSLVNWTSNIWLGVSVEDEKTLNRVDFLRTTNAKIKFLSCEPLIAPLPNLELKNIDWVIVGGESGKGNIREMREEWVMEIKEKCEKLKVDFFFKQWGGANKKKAGRLLAGRTFDAMPNVAIR
jgi:protein gp37